MQIFRPSEIANRDDMAAGAALQRRINTPKNESSSRLEGIQLPSQSRNGGIGRGFIKKIASTVKCMRVLNPLQLFKNRTESQTQSVMQSNVSITSVVAEKPVLDKTKFNDQLITHRVQPTPNAIDTVVVPKVIQFKSAVSIPKVIHVKTAGLTNDLYRDRLEQSLRNQLKQVAHAKDGSEKISSIALGFVRASAEKKIGTLAKYLAKSKEGCSVEDQQKIELGLFGATIKLHDKHELLQAVEQWRKQCANNQKAGLDNSIYFGLLDKLCLKASQSEPEKAEAIIQSIDHSLNKNGVIVSAVRSGHVKELIKKFNHQSEAKSVGTAALVSLSQKMHDKSDSMVEILLDNINTYDDDISFLDPGLDGIRPQRFETQRLEI